MTLELIDGELGPPSPLPPQLSLVCNKAKVQERTSLGVSCVFFSVNIARLQITQTLYSNGQKKKKNGVNFP